MDTRIISDDLSGEEDVDYLEVPSLIESLASSACQLKQLAELTSQYYIRGLLSYGYIIHEPSNRDGPRKSRPTTVTTSRRSRQLAGEASDPIPAYMQEDRINLEALNNDEKTLASLDSLVSFLPFLNDLSAHIERCFTTIEIAFKRFNYHLNKQSASASKSARRSINEFKAPPESRFDPIFVSIMDLSFALISLDETIKSHSNISHSIGALKQVCQMILNDNKDGLDRTEGLNLDPSDDGLSENKLKGLLDLIRNVELTVCDENRTIFKQCLEHLQHMDLILTPKGKLKNGMKTISERLDEFIAFQADSLACSSKDNNSQALFYPNNLKSGPEITLYLMQANLAPTAFMTSLERKVLGLSSLFILNSWIFKKPDKKLAKSFNQMLQRFKQQINLIHLAESNCFVSLREFLIEHLPKGIIDGRTLSQLELQDQQLLGLDLNQYFNETTLEVMSCLVRLRGHDILGPNASMAVGSSRHQTNEPATSLMNAIQDWQSVLQKCLNLIDEINHTIRSIIAVHLKHSRPITRNNLILILRLVALLKSIVITLERDEFKLIDLEIQKERLLRSKWRKLMMSARKRSITSRYSDRKLDSSSSLILFALCSNIVDRLRTDCGRCVLSMALSMLAPSLNSDELIELNLMLSMMRPDFRDTLDNRSNCAYLYWNVPTFNTYYNYTFEEDPGNIGEISYFHRALDDMRQLFSFDSQSSGGGGGLFKMAASDPQQRRRPSSAADEAAKSLSWLVERRNKFLENLSNELWDQFTSHTLDKICQELEIELRLQTHRDLHLDGHNPFRRHLYNFKRIFADSRDPKRQQVFTIFGRSVSLRQYVERHMSEVYYNLISLAPNDWFTYDCMINLAEQKYGLQLINSQMPTQTLDCGVDLMEITRNLSLFVTRYSYDMSNQLFIEKCSSRWSSVSSSSAATASVVGSATAAAAAATATISNQQPAGMNQSLNVIQIRHVSMSIQNHGFGLLNSAINCTYQTMKRLVALISRRLADDRLRAALTKEHQLMSNSQLALSSIGFDKAQRLAKKFKIHPAGQMPDDEASAGGQKMPPPQPPPPPVDLDSIRQSITQLGNALAFMRLLKSGALNCASRSVDYLPDLDDTSLLRLGKLVRSEFSQRQLGQHPASGESLLDAAINFDGCLEDFDEHFSPKTDYFSIVLGLFSEALNGSKPAKRQHAEGGANDTEEKEEGQEDGEATRADPQLQQGGSSRRAGRKHDHLRLFFILVPSLTVNYIDYIINAKERVVSRSSANRVGALISDDGFSMGVAFLLTVLNQSNEFNKLQWFREVRVKLDTDLAEVERRIGNSKYEESLKQTSSMTLRRLNRLKIEYDGLDYTTSSALLLFRSSSTEAASRSC